MSSRKGEMDVIRRLFDADDELKRFNLVLLPDFETGFQGIFRYL
mgnify:CR=1 FL=1